MASMAMLVITRWYMYQMSKGIRPKMASIWLSYLSFLHVLVKKSPAVPALQEPSWGCPWSQPALFLIFLEQLPSSTTHFRSMFGVFSLHQGSNFPPCHGESSGSSTEVAASGRTPKGRSRKGVSESSWR